MQHIESPFILTQREKEDQARKALACQIAATFAWGMAVGMIAGFLLLTFAR